MYKHALSYKHIVFIPNTFLSKCSNLHTIFAIAQSSSFRQISSYISVQPEILRNNNLTEKRGDETSIVNVERVNKNFAEVNKQQKKQGNLIPTEYRKVFWTLVASQDKFNKVFDKLIVAIDNAKEPIVKEAQLK